MLMGGPAFPVKSAPLAKPALPAKPALLVKPVRPDKPDFPVKSALPTRPAAPPSPALNAAILAPVKLFILPFSVGQEFAIHGYLDSIALGVLHLVYVKAEVNCRHDSIAKLLLNHIL